MLMETGFFLLSVPNGECTLRIMVVRYDMDVEIVLPILN